MLTLNILHLLVKHRNPKILPTGRLLHSFAMAVRLGDYVYDVMDGCL